MDWRYSDRYFAYDMATGQLVDCSGYRMVCTVPYRPEGGVTTCGPCVCLPNRVFWPVDWLCAAPLAPLPTKSRLLVRRPSAAYERGPLSHLPASGSAPAEAHARGFPAMTGEKPPHDGFASRQFVPDSGGGVRAVQPPRQA